MVPLLSALLVRGFLVSSPMLPQVGHSTSLESVRRSFALPAAEHPVEPAVQPLPTPPLPPPLRLPSHNLFAAALRWGMLHASDVDDVMLALVSPETFWVLRSWQQRTYGDQRQRAMALQAARADLTKGVLDGELARQVSFVSVRGKGLWSTFHKSCVRQQKVHDVLALRVVIRGEEEDCRRVLASVHNAWPSVGGRFKDYISTPKRNGYRALHDTVLIPGGFAMEIQIRTTEMHEQAEFGTASHRRYKGALFQLPRTMLAGVGAPPAPLRLRSPLLHFWAI